MKEIIESLLDVDLHFLDLNDIANYANEWNKNEENTASMESIEHNMNDVRIVFVQETRKHNLFHACGKPHQEEFDVSLTFSLVQKCSVRALCVLKFFILWFFLSSNSFLSPRLILGVICVVLVIEKWPNKSHCNKDK